jgi:hypothetical protein
VTHLPLFDSRKFVKGQSRRRDGPMSQDLDMGPQIQALAVTESHFTERDVISVLPDLADLRLSNDYGSEAELVQHIENQLIRNAVFYRRPGRTSVSQSQSYRRDAPYRRKGRQVSVQL